MIGEGSLCLEVYTPVLEIGIEPLLRFPVAVDESMCLIIVYVKRSCFMLFLEIPCHTVGNGMVQDAVTYKVDEPVARHSGPVLSEKCWMLFDEADDIVVFSFRRLKAA